MQGSLYRRSDKVFFMKIPGEAECIRKMCGFTALDITEKPIEYSRQYADDAFVRTSAVGRAVSVRFAFDRCQGDPVHDCLCALIEADTAGEGAHITLYSVDMKEQTERDGKPSYSCLRRVYSLLPESRSAEAGLYGYAGEFRADGEAVRGRAVLSEDGQSLEFYEED